MRLASKNEQILHIYFIAKKKKKIVFLFHLSTLLLKGFPV